MKLDEMIAVLVLVGLFCIGQLVLAHRCFSVCFDFVETGQWKHFLYAGLCGMALVWLSVEGFDKAVKELKGGVR